MTALDGAEGWAYAVSGRVRGTALDDLSGEAVARTLPSLLRALDAAARVDLAGTSGYGIWTPDGLAPHASWPEALLAIGTETPRVPGWRAALVDSGIGLGPVEAGLSALAALTPCLPDARRLIHGDLLSRNVLAGEAGITGVLDWGNALYGDPLYDAAWLLHWWPWYPGWRPGDLHAALLTHWRATGPTPAHLAGTPARLPAPHRPRRPRLLRLPGPLGRGARPRRHRADPGVGRWGRECAHSGRCLTGRGHRVLRGPSPRGLR